MSNDDVTSTLLPASAATAVRVLVVEDELSIRDTIVYALESEGMVVDWTASGAEALAKAKQIPYHLIVLDVGLPDLSGFDVCRTVRKTSSVPIIFLTARSSEIDRVVGLEIGSDDYVTKPFSPRELTARVRANIRRARLQDCRGQQESIEAFGEVAKPAAALPFRVDYERWVIHYYDQPLSLSRYEFRLLVLLVENPGRVYSRAQLMDAAWEEPDASMERTVDAHIKSVRAKLRLLREDVDPIVTHRGVGYAMKEIW